MDEQADDSAPADAVCTPLLAQLSWLCQVAPITRPLVDHIAPQDYLAQSAMMLDSQIGPLGCWRRLVFVAALTLVACDDDPSGRSEGPLACTSIGCGSAFTLRTFLDVELATLAGARVMVCRGDECRSGRLARPPRCKKLANGEDAGCAGDSSDADVLATPLMAADESDAGYSNSFANVRNEGSPARAQLSLSWYEPGADGDEYAISIVNSNGMEVFTAHETVDHYTVSYPNTAPCGPMCLQYLADHTK